MFIGHYAPAFLAAAVSPRAPRLGTLFVAAQFLDYGFFGLTLVGLEHARVVPGFTRMVPLDLYDMPLTHSLLGAAGWAGVMALLMLAWHGMWRPALVAAAVVLSHWPIDLLVHAPDLTLAGTPPKLGFGLWNHPAVAIPLELLFAFGAFAFYIARTRSLGPVGRREPVILAVLLLAVQAINWWGPAPEAFTAATAILALVVYTLLAYVASWTDRCRELRTIPAPTPAITPVAPPAEPAPPAALADVAPIAPRG